MSRRLAAAVLAATLVLVAAIPIAYAGPGVALGPSKMTFDDALGQGETVDLPTLVVRNGGDDPGLYTMDILRIVNQEELSADPSWFRFDPAQFELQPATTQLVRVKMQIPREAVVGEYLSLLRAAAGALEQQRGSAVATGAVASTLRFTVKNVNFHFYDPVIDFYGGRAPFSYIGTGMLLGLLAVYLFQRRYGLDINVGVSRKE